DSTMPGLRALVWMRGTQRTTVLRLPDDTHQVFGAQFDGRWLVFSVLDQPNLDSTWTMYAWDSSAGGTPRQLARSSVHAPYAYPLVLAGQAFWTVAVSAGQTQLHMSNLSRGTDRVIRSGVPGYPFRFGPLVVWPEMPPGGEKIELAAASAETGEPVP